MQVQAATPRVLGILNLSADSFSDGGLFTEPDVAVAHAERLVTHGAWAVDVGAVSSNPESGAVSAAEEIRRLAPVLEGLDQRGIRVSLDSFTPETQRWAAGRVAVLNDIGGFADPETWPVLADAGCALVVMHSVQRGPADRRHTDVAGLFDAICRFFDQRLEDLVGAGVSEDRIVIDPGMGFFLGDRPEPSFAILRRLPELRAHTGRPVLVSVSRKSFLGAAIGGRPPMERRVASAVAELWAARHGADWVRTHEPRALFDALAVHRALEGPGPSAGTLTDEEAR